MDQIARLFHLAETFIAARAKATQALLMACLLIVFSAAQMLVGETWDQDIHRYGFDEIRRFAGAVLSGDFNKDFEDIYFNMEYYGLLPVLPAEIVTGFANSFFDLDAAQDEAVFRWALHFNALLWAAGSVIIVYKLLLRLTADVNMALIGAGFLALYPVWFGHALFNYKDLAQAFFYVLALYGAIIALGNEKADFYRGLWFVVAATIGSASIKLLGAPLLIVQWSALLFVALQADMRLPRLRALMIGSLVTLVGIYIITPPAWLEPVRFVILSISYMSQHEWVGCVISAGSCLSPQKDDWSVLSYLILWISARWPLVLMLGALPAALYLALRGTAAERVITAAVIVPLALIILRNSAVYDGLRHILFIVPVLVCMLVAAIHKIKTNRPALHKTARLAMTASLAVFIVDNVRMFPYNYIYFNEISRLYVDAETFETDYWGLSLRRAAAAVDTHVTASPAGTYTSLIGYPVHLVHPYVRNPLAPWDGRTSDRPDSRHIWAGYTLAFTAPPPDCTEVARTEKRLTFAPKRLLLSSVATCPPAPIAE